EVQTASDTEDCFFFFKQKTAYEIGLGIPAEPLFRSASLPLIKEMQQQDNHEYPFLYQRQTCHQVQPNQATYQKRQKCQPATYLQEVRSEERRVGKESRCRWEADELKKRRRNSEERREREK